MPLVTVDIQELVPHDSGEDAEQAAVFIKPRRPASAQQLVSLVLEVTRERATDATVRCESPSLVTIRSLVYKFRAACGRDTTLSTALRSHSTALRSHCSVLRLSKTSVSSLLSFSTRHNRAGGRHSEARCSVGG